jgi:dihydrofolate reductase
VIGIISSISLDRVIGIQQGKRGRLPWNPKIEARGDLKRFYELTKGHVVIMGRKTYESIGHYLRDRENIVVSRSPGVIVDPNIKQAKSLQSAFDIASLKPQKNVWIIGGGQLYKFALQYADLIDLTVVPKKVYEQRSGNMVYFPTIDESEWHRKTFKHPYNRNLLVIRYDRK